MLLGHYAIALAAKKATPKTSLGTLIVAAQLPDLLFPLFTLLGMEHFRISPGITAVFPVDLYDYPFSHSLLAGLIWSVVFGLAYYGVRRDNRGAIVLALVVVSHWILDYITHRPDLSLGFGTATYVGLGLWHSVAGTLVVEAGLFLAGMGIYLWATKAKDRIGSIGFWTLTIVLATMYLGSFFGPPPSTGAVSTIVMELGALLLILWAFWIDKHRIAREA